MAKKRIIKLHITDHAYERYCERVQEITYEQLVSNCFKQLQEVGYIDKKECFIQMRNIWWCYERVGRLVTFISCYGRTSIDLPKALKWAEYNNDKINLIDSVAVDMTSYAAKQNERAEAIMC
jgi:hypothetical protein